MSEVINNQADANRIVPELLKVWTSANPECEECDPDPAEGDYPCEQCGKYCAGCGQPDTGKCLCCTHCKSEKREIVAIYSGVERVDWTDIVTLDEFPGEAHFDALFCDPYLIEDDIEYEGATLDKIIIRGPVDTWECFACGNIHPIPDDDIYTCELGLERHSKCDYELVKHFAPPVYLNNIRYTIRQCEEVGVEVEIERLGKSPRGGKGGWFMKIWGTAPGWPEDLRKYAKVKA